MSVLDEQIRDIAGTRFRFLRGGPPAEPIVFIHGGVPGQTPYCSSADLWAPSLDLFARRRQVVALDMPGAGGTGGMAGDWLTVAAFGRHVRALIDALQLGPCHLVGHDPGGLVALWLAMDSPMLVRSVTIVASPTAAPSGDGVANLALADPPAPLWSRASQAWAFDRLSYAHHHIDAALLDRCVAWSAGAAHRQAVEIVAQDALQRLYLPSVGDAKARLYELCRDAGLAVPVQIVWGTNDPLTTIDHGFMLYRVVAARQAAAQFHLINRAGSFPFREEPETFHQIVASFQDGLAAN